ncbi:extracellular solute-binding protein [Gracilibacillus alcaliphilus]|uniref:extracellular solute-binding protein n=1 Tax=Gracilibacillus alcaliphilus TaxID=1401441 RepID=UPI0019578F07|nr:extracellular solute-binding protein [Gracilibacillus alcaliphilus]MBM7676806.1 putative aldouronate transport system substrate-binding protein [Gracilibacillus alcaliphilus]
MKRYKTVRNSVLGLIMLLSFISVIACSSDDTIQSSDQAGDQAASISIVLNNAGRSFPDGMDGNKNPYMEYIEENVNVDIELIYPPAEAYEERLNVIMASGDLPDMLFSHNPSWFVDYVNQNALEPLDDLLKEHGQNLLDNIPAEAWENVTIDGNIYAVPRITTYPGDHIMYVRQDWLDNLAINPPKTLEEYEDVMRAFVEEDPDGNGKNDTMGLIIGENLARTQPFFGAFGIQRSQWVERDGELVYTSTLPETKEVLELLRNWYSEGLIDKEWALNSTSNIEEKIANEDVGLFSAHWYDTRGPIQTNLQNNPDAEWLPLEYPEGPGDQSGTAGPHIVSGYSVIPVTSENPEAVIRMLDFMIGEGYTTLKFGFEDDVWQMEGDEMVTDFEKHNDHLYRLTLAEVVEPDNMDYVNLRLDSLGKHFNLVDNLERASEHAIKSEFLGTPTPSMGRYAATLEQTEVEVFTNIIMGNLSIDDFDVFVNDWYANGGQDITDEVNEWFKDYQTQN